MYFLKYVFTFIVQGTRTLFSALQLYGLTIVDSMPCMEYTLDTLVNRMGFIKPTHYGLHFAVKARANANNLAYTASPLGLHIDLPFYIYNPGVQLLHCIQQYEMEGAENEFVDGFYLANMIRDKFPKEYKTLTTVPVDFWDVGVEEEPYGEFHKVTSIPSFM
jgi:gamma-butyrobetaine dioxygenase